jgi:hypothetical protein
MVEGARLFGKHPAELMRLADGDAISVQGAFKKVELYEREDYIYFHLVKPSRGMPWRAKAAKMQVLILRGNRPAQSQ